MKNAWVMFCLLTCVMSAHAQTPNGVSNVRDASGNLVRNNGLKPAHSLAPRPVTNPVRPDNRSGAVAPLKTWTDNGAIR